MYTQLTLTNLISNGGFEADTTGWTGSHTLTRIAVPTPVHGEAGSWAAQVSGSVNGAIFATLASFSVVSGRRYYIRARIRHSTNNYANQCALQNNTTALSPAISQTMSVNQWALIDGIWTANSNSLQLRLNFTGGNGNQQRTVQFDNVMVIDLTTAYGAGNEPTREAVRQLIADNNGFWDGAKTIEIPLPVMKTFGAKKEVAWCCMSGRELKGMCSGGKIFYKKIV